MIFYFKKVSLLFSFVWMQWGKYTFQLERFYTKRKTSRIRTWNCTRTLLDRTHVNCILYSSKCCFLPFLFCCIIVVLYLWDSAWAIQRIPTWQGIDGFQISLHPCALGESSLGIGRVKTYEVDLPLCQKNPSDKKNTPL